jgi:hypothetical protein
VAESEQRSAAARGSLSHSRNVRSDDPPSQPTFRRPTRLARNGWVRSREVNEEPTTARELWLALVVAGIRSKFGAAALVLMLAIAVWQFASGNFRVGAIVAAVIIVTNARVVALIGIAIGSALAARQRRRS